MTREELIERLAKAEAYPVDWEKLRESNKEKYRMLVRARQMPTITELVRDWLKTQDYLDESSREAVLCSWWDEMGQEPGS